MSQRSFIQSMLFKGALMCEPDSSSCYLDTQVWAIFHLGTTYPWIMLSAVWSIKICVKFLSIVDYSPNAYKDLFSQIPKSWTPYLYHSNSLSPSFFLSKSPWPRWHGLLISVNKTVEFGIRNLAFGDLVLLQEVKFQGSNQRKIYFLSLAVGQVNCWNTWCSVVWMYNNLIDSLILWRLS